MANLQIFSDGIDKVMEGLRLMKSALGSAAVASLTAEPAPVEDFGDFDSLKKALLSNKWPAAVPAALICDPEIESNKVERGQGVMQMLIEEDKRNLRFLDYGCGEGHCAAAAADSGAAVSVGFDIKDHEKWKDLQTSTRSN